MASQMMRRVKVDMPRPDRSLFKAFEGATTGNVADAMNRVGAMDYRIKPVGAGMRCIGPALTIRIRPCDNLIIYKALEIAQPGDVLLIATSEFETSATWGDLTSMISLKKGLAGMVTDGHVRDAEGIREVGFPIFSRGVMPNSPFKDGPGEINFPVSCGGLPVHPGDIIFGDDDGVVVIPQEDFPQVAEKVPTILEKEAKTVKAIENGQLIPDWVAPLLAEKEFEIIE